MIKKTKKKYYSYPVWHKTVIHAHTMCDKRVYLVSKSLKLNIPIKNKIHYYTTTSGKYAA